MLDKWNQQGGKCALTGLQMITKKGIGQIGNSCSIDRIDSNKGYVKDNIRLVRADINRFKGTWSDNELLEMCSRILSKREGIYQPQYIPNLNTFSCLLDRLAIEVHKIAYFENFKRKEHEKDNPSVNKIVLADNNSRNACEIRSYLKSELNQFLADIFNTRSYFPPREIRTFKSSDVSFVSDIIEKMYERNANASLVGELSRELEQLLKCELRELN